MKSLPLVTLAALLALGACNKAPETTDNAAVNVADAEALDNFDDDAPAIVEDVANAPAVAVPAVPKPAAGAVAAEAEPLNDAATIEEEIRGGRGIKRIRHGEGWAWTRDGKILRTADRDGDNVAYFRRGDARPFFVQHEGRSFAYQGDKPVREFDRDGRGGPPNADRTREATEAARDAREQRERAERAREAAVSPNRPAGQRPDRDRREAAPTPTPTATATPRAGRDRGDRDASGRPDWNGEQRPRPERQ